ncbi:MAG: hypothetical protein ABI972_09025 [Acidobacteriota bacterium]
MKIQTNLRFSAEVNIPGPTWKHLNAAILGIPRIIENQVPEKHERSLVSLNQG